MPVPACSLCPSLSSAPIESVSAALGREQGRLDRNKRFKAKTPKLRIQVAPESTAQSDRNWISWWADETPSLLPTPISPKHPTSPSSPLSFFTNRYITSPTTSTFSNIPPMPRGPTTTMASSPATLRGSKSLSVLTDRTPATSRHSAKQMFAKIKKLASRSTLKEEHLQPREPSPRRPIPTVSFAPSISSAASFIEFDDAESVVVDNDAASAFVPYLPLVAQYERAQCDRSIRSSATKSTFSRDVYDHSPLSPSPSVNSIRSMSTTSTATEPYSPMTPVTPCFAAQQAELGDLWECPSPGIRASYASSSGIPLSPREVRGRTSSTPAHIPWINRKPSTFLQKHAKPAPTAPLPRVPGVTPTSDTEDPQDSFDEELKDCAGVQQIRARKEAFSGQTRVVRQRVVDRKRGDGEWTLFLGAAEVDAGAKGKESKIMKRHSAGVEKEERWAGEKMTEGRKRVKSESRPASRGVGEDWTLSLPLPMPDVPKREATVSLTERKPHGEGEASEGSETPTESQPTPKVADKPRLSISRRTSPAPSAGSRRIETIRRPLPFGPSPPASPITPGYASRFPSTTSLVSSKRFGGSPPSPITPTARRESKRRSAHSSSGEESLPRPETMESVASTESCSSTATVTLPREKAPTPILEPELMWEEEELECPMTPRMPTIVTSEVEFDFEEEGSDTDSSSVYYSAQSSISICMSR